MLLQNKQKHIRNSCWSNLQSRTWLILNLEIGGRNLVTKPFGLRSDSRDQRIADINRFSHMEIRSCCSCLAFYLHVYGYRFRTTIHYSIFRSSHQGCSIKKLFFGTSYYSQENIWRPEGLKNILIKTPTQVFFVFFSEYWKSLEHLFWRTKKKLYQEKKFWTKKKLQKLFARIQLKKAWWYKQHLWYKTWRKIFLVTYFE